MYEPDDYEIEEEFNSMISNLSFSKDSIGKTTKYAMEYITYSSELFYLIVKKMKKCSVRRKIALFYLIDSIVQNSRTKARNEYILLTAKYLNYLIDLMLYPLFHTSNPTPETADDKEQCIKTVQKVLNLWESRNTLCIAEVPLNEVIKEAYNELQNPSYPKSPVRDPITKKRYSPYAEEDEKSVDDILKKIEEYRRENKRIRWESRLRPAKEAPFAEFEEQWEKVTMDDVKATIRDYDLKMAYLEGTAPKPFSPGSSMSPPSPSPSTPYSPSVAVKRGNEKMAPPTQSKYSPSSPNSSPEKSRRESSSSNDRDRRKSYSGPEVFIWDLDETLIIVNSLTRHVSKKNRGTAERLIRDLEDVLYEILEDFMFYKDLRDHDQVRINELLNRYDDGRDLRSYEFSRDGFPSDFTPVKLSYRYRVIRDIYIGRIQLRNHISEKIVDRIDRICAEINDLTDGWLSEARKTLDLALSCRDVTHILVSSGHMVSTIAKLVIFRLNGYFDLRNIWASGTTGKRYCFERILRDYPRSRVSVIGDGPEEEKLSRDFDLPFYKIRSANDLYRLGQSVFKNL